MMNHYDDLLSFYSKHLIVNINLFESIYHTFHG